MSLDDIVNGFSQTVQGMAGGLQKMLSGAGQAIQRPVPSQIPSGPTPGFAIQDLLNSPGMRQFQQQNRQALSQPVPQPLQPLAGLAIGLNKAVTNAPVLGGLNTLMHNTANQAQGQIETGAGQLFGRNPQPATIPFTNINYDPRIAGAVNLGLGLKTVATPAWQGFVTAGNAIQQGLEQVPGLKGTPVPAIAGMVGPMVANPSSAQGLIGRFKNGMHPDDIVEAEKAINLHNSLNGSLNDVLSQSAQDAEKTIRTIGEHYLGAEAGKWDIAKLKDALQARINFDRHPSDQVMGLVKGQPQGLNTTEQLGNNGLIQNETQTPVQALLKGRGEKVSSGQPVPLANNNIESQIKERMGQNTEPLPWETPEYQKANPTPQERLPNVKPEELSPGGVSSGKGPEVRTYPQTTEGVLAKHFEVTQNLQQRGNLLQQQIQNGVRSAEETALFRDSIEHPENLEANLAKVSNPNGFATAVKAFQDFTDYTHGELTKQGGDPGYLKDYYMHILDLSDPKMAAKFEDMTGLKAKNYNGWYNKERIFKNIDELQAAGFKLKNQSAAEDIGQYTGAVNRELSGRVLSNELKKVQPDAVYVARGSHQNPPANFIQLHVPGAQGTYVAPNLYQDLKHLERPDLGSIWGAFDKVNSKIKNIKLAGGGFHAINTGLDYVFNELGHLRLPNIIEMGKVFVSPQAMMDYKSARIADGTLDKAGSMGVTLGKMADLGDFTSDAVSMVKNHNPISWLHQATFDRLINFFKLETVKNIDTSGMNEQEARAVGQQVNNIFGGQNLELLRRNPITQAVLRAVTLAPDYQEGRFRRTASALNLTNWSPANNLARISLLSRVVGTAILAEVGRRVVTGSFDTNVKDAIQHAFLDPSIPLPGVNDKGKKEEAVLPASNLSDIARLIQDPRHFGISHLSAGGSVGLQTITGENYYGEPLVDPFAKDQGPIPQAIELAKSNLLPIPAVQVNKLLSNNASERDAALNVIGLRTRVDPNDPTMQYFNSLGQASNSLTPNDKNIFMGQIHPTSKDRSGNPVVDKNYLSTPAKFETFLSNPKVYQAELAFEQSQPNHDPLWDWPEAQRQAYMHAQVISKNDPGGDKATTNTLYATIPQQLFDQRTAFFNGLVSQGVMQATTQAPQMPKSISDFWNYEKSLPYGTGARTQALQTPIGQSALAWLQQSADLTNAQRADMGLPLLNASSSSGGTSYGRSNSQAVGAYKARSAIRKQMKMKIGTPKIKSIAKLPLQRITLPKSVSAIPFTKKSSKAVAYKVPKGRKKPIKLA